MEKSGRPAPEFCEKLLTEARVLVFPGTLFGDKDDRYIRLSLLQPVERIREAVARLKDAKSRIFA